MLPLSALKVAFASFWVNSELRDWVPAGQEWGLQGRFPQHCTDRWSERGEPSVWVSHWQPPSGIAPAVERFLSQAEEGHRPLLRAQVVAPWGCTLLPDEVNEGADFREYRWAICWWVGGSRSMPLGKLPEYAWSYWQSRSDPLVVSLAFSLVTCHGHPSPMKCFVRVYSNLWEDSVVSSEVDKRKPVLAYSFTFTLPPSFLPSWFSSPNVTSVGPLR